MLLHTKYLRLWASCGFREEDFSRFLSHYKSMGAKGPRGGANFDPRGMNGRIYVGDHLMLLHTKYQRPGLMVSEKKIFEGFYSIISLWQLIVARGRGQF